MDAVHERLIVRAKGALSLGIRQAELVELLWNLSTCVLEGNWVTIGINRAERLVNLDEGTIRHLLDNAGLDTVLQNFTVRALQTNADAVGHEVCNRRQDDQADTTNPGHRVERNLEEVRYVVVTTGQRDQQEEYDGSCADGGTGRNIARTLQ